MNIATIKKNDIANGPGVRVSVFVSGCRHACPGCFNREAWDFDFGVPYTTAIEAEVLEALAPPFVEGLTLLGGEPFEPSNQRALVPFLEKVREQYPQKSIWSFSGFTLEELQTDGSHPRCEVTDRMLSLLDVLVDGRYVDELRNLSLRFRGSSNQRLIDMKATLREGSIVLWDA